MQYVIFWDLDFSLKSILIRFIHILCFNAKGKKSTFLWFELRRN